MGHGLLHQSNTSGRIGAVLARSKNSHGLGEKVGVGAITLRGDARRDQADLLYSKVRRGTQVAQGRGLQNLHSWVRIPPAPPDFTFNFSYLAFEFFRPWQYGSKNLTADAQAYLCIQSGYLVGIGSTLRLYVTQCSLTGTRNESL